MDEEFGVYSSSGSPHISGPKQTRSEARLSIRGHITQRTHKGTILSLHMVTIHHLITSCRLASVLDSHSKSL